MDVGDERETQRQTGGPAGRGHRIAGYREAHGRFDAERVATETERAERGETEGPQESPT
jgi:hypothetical protein